MNNKEIGFAFEKIIEKGYNIVESRDINIRVETYTIVEEGIKYYVCGDYYDYYIPYEDRYVLITWKEL